MEHAARKDAGMVLALYGYWTDVNIRDIEGNTALHYAVMVGTLKFVKVRQLMYVGLIHLPVPNPNLKTKRTRNRTQI